MAERPSRQVAAETSIECQSCQASLNVAGSGTYKCPRCLSLFSYDAERGAHFLPRRGAAALQLSLSFSDDATQGLLGLVLALAQRAGFSEEDATSLQDAVQEVIQAIHRHAYGGRENQVYHAMVLRSGAEIELRFADHGSAIPADRQGEDGRPLFSTARAVMDRFDINHPSRGGNVLTFAKKAR